MSHGGRECHAGLGYLWSCPGQLSHCRTSLPYIAHYPPCGCSCQSQSAGAYSKNRMTAFSMVTHAPCWTMWMLLRHLLQVFVCMRCLLWQLPTATLCTFRLLSAGSNASCRCSSMYKISELRLKAGKTQTMTSTSGTNRSCCSCMVSLCYECGKDVDSRVMLHLMRAHTL